MPQVIHSDVDSEILTLMFISTIYLAKNNQ